MPINRDPSDHAADRARAIGIVMAFGCAAVSAIQPVAIRFGAVRLDPLTFAAAATVVAALCTVPMLYARGELLELVDRRYRTRLGRSRCSGRPGRRSP